MDTRSDLIRACGMIDPHNVVTCLGVTKRQTSCKNRIAQESRKLASELLDLVAKSPRAESVLQGILKKISGLMLCKKNHQDQASTLFESWYQEYQRQQPPTSYSNSYQIGSQNNPVDLAPVALDIGPPWPEARPVSIEAVRRKEVPFDVSPTQPAEIISNISSSHAVSVILCSLSHSQGPSEECSICRDTLTQEEPVSLTCETCQTDIHLHCMELWLNSRPMGNSYCPVCRMKRRYNAIYSTPTIARETPMAAPITEERTTVPTQATAGESSAQRPRRSGRSRRPPSRYV